MTVDCGADTIATIHDHEEDETVLLGEFIVRACNSHEELVEALEACVEGIRHATDCGQVHCKRCDKADESAARGREVIARAKGERNA